MTIKDLVNAMEKIAPLEYAESWDKVGLLLGNRHRDITGPIILTIDLTEAVLAEAISCKASAIIAYHPPVWEPLTKITDATPRQRIVMHALEAGIAIYSPHTALDAVSGGVTDWLCEGLSGADSDSAGPAGKIKGDCRALIPFARGPQTQQVKIVSFVPVESLDRVRDALASAGAGIIGAYRVCSFASDGTGTFLGDGTSRPHIGLPGQIEHVREARLEMVCSRAALALAIETVRRFHPYEEPAVDVYPLEAQPVRTVGPGRRLVLDRPATILELAERLKKWTQRERVRYALAPGMDTSTGLTFVGVCPGSGASLSKVAKGDGCQVYITGEMNHHDVMGALNAGMSVILGNHTSTERGYLWRLARSIESHLPHATVRLSGQDRDPLVNV